MTAPRFQFQRAARRAVKLKIGIDGPSGSGKTFGAMSLALGITNGGRVAVADSENGSASYYADRFAFDTLNIPDAEPSTYKAIIDAAVAAEFDALIIDSISHAWLTILAAKEEYDRAHPKSNSWTNWRMFGPKWDGLIKHILDAPIHVIATMRSKQAYEQVENAGKKTVVKLGLQPQVRDGAEYEFGLVFSVEQNHLAQATKDRTMLFAGREVDLASPELHAELIAWMNTRAPAASDAPATAPSQAPARPQLHREPATREQKMQIGELLAHADLDEAAKAATRAIAADEKKPLSAARADEIIVKLRRLQQPTPASVGPTPAISADGKVAPPGKIADALELTSAASMMAAPASQEASLRQRIIISLGDKRLSDDHRGMLRDRLEGAGDDLAALLQLYADVAAAIDGLPF